MKFENVVFPDKLGFKCKRCGRCCRDAPADVNAEEQQLIESKGFTDFLDYPDGTPQRFIKRKSDGSCLFLTKENKCSIYEVRPMICRLAPFDVRDWDYEKNLIEVDFRPELICDGISAEGDVPIEVIGKAAQAFVREMLEMVAKKEGLPITSTKVLSLTRILMMGMLGEP